MTLAEAIASIPVGYYLHCAVEVVPESESTETFLTATIMQVPPDSGWPSLDAYFGDVGYVDDGRLLLYKYDDAARVGISSGDVKDYEALIISMIADRWPPKEK